MEVNYSNARSVGVIALQRKPVGLAVAGYGEWGPNHVRVFRELSEARVVGVADSDPERRGEAGRRYPDIRAEQDFGALLDAPEVEAVVVATPTATHYELCRRALAAGRHVLCEKPLTIAPKQSEELVALAESVQKVLMVGHVFLHNPGIRKLKDLIATGELGEIHFLRSLRTNLGPIRHDTNCLYDLASHDVSIFNFLLGATPIQVSAVGQSYIREGVEDVAILTLTYPGRILATASVTWLDPRKVRFIAVTGDRRMATWDDLARVGPVMVYDKGVVRRRIYRDFGEFNLITREGEVSIPRVAGREPLLDQATHFLECIRHAATPVSDGSFGARVVKVLDACQASMRQGGAPVSL